VVDQGLPRDPSRKAAVKPLPDGMSPERTADAGRRHALAGLAAGVLGLAGFARPALAQEAGALDKVRQRGTLTVAVYLDHRPFHDAGQGIEARLAEALARGLGVKAALMPFPAGENMEDDLRNMVWRGHYLGFGPADVLMHVPVEAAFMAANPQVRIFGPYWRESVVLARRKDLWPRLDSVADLKGRRIVVAGQSLPGWLLLGAEGGVVREEVSTKIRDGVEAATMLKTGAADAAAGLRSEVEGVLGQDERFIVEPLPGPRSPRERWAVGMAVKKNATDLAQALQAALNGLADSGELKDLFQAGGLAWQRP
jgi:ABC-type amino acid transport substrate-binding protein